MKVINLAPTPKNIPFRRTPWIAQNRSRVMQRSNAAHTVAAPPEDDPRRRGFLPAGSAGAVFAGLRSAVAQAETRRWPRSTQRSSATGPRGAPMTFATVLLQRHARTTPHCRRSCAICTPMKSASFQASRSRSIVMAPFRSRTMFTSTRRRDHDDHNLAPQPAMSRRPHFAHQACAHHRQDRGRIDDDRRESDAGGLAPMAAAPANSRAIL